MILCTLFAKNFLGFLQEWKYFVFLLGVLFMHQILFPVTEKEKEKERKLRFYLLIPLVWSSTGDVGYHYFYILLNLINSLANLKQHDWLLWFYLYLREWEYEKMMWKMLKLIFQESIYYMQLCGQGLMYMPPWSR